MSLWNFTSWRAESADDKDLSHTSRRRFDKATCGDLELIMIAKKLEMAASMGDYGMMNQLNQEFKRVKNNRLREALRKAEICQAEAELVA